MSVLDIVVPMLAVSAGSFVTGLAGFGFGLVAMGILPWFMGARDSSVLVTLFSVLNLGAGLFQLRGHLRFRSVVPLLLGLAAGVPLGVYLLASLDEIVLKRALGAAIGLYLAVDLLLLARLTFRMPPIVGVVAGLLGGALGGAFSTGGPPGLIYVTSQRWDKERAKATVLAYLLGMSLYKLPFLVAGGLVTREVTIRFALWLAPVAACAYAGMRLFGRMSTPAFGLVLRILLAASAVLLIVAP